MAILNQICICIVCLFSAHISLFLLFFFPFYCHISDAPSVSVHLANEEPIPSRLVIRPERDNVTLKCRADANPPAESYGWFKNVIFIEDYFLQIFYLYLVVEYLPF